MEKQKVDELILRYNTAQATPADLRQIESLLEQGVIELETLKQDDRIIDHVSRLDFPSPSLDLDDRFYQMLALEKKVKASFSWREFFSWPQLAPKLALASVTLMLGIAIGYLTRPAESKVEIATVTQELKQLREMMMLSLLEKESATERLKAVSLTEGMDEASTKVTEALIQTLNEDGNVNVRLAALEALAPYAKDSQVRQELIRSIARQESPLVQVALAELMAAMQVKSSVQELQKIIQSEKTPADIKKKIKQSIDVLI